MFDLGIRPEWDYENVMAFAEKKGRAIGIEEGFQNGEFVGIKKGEHGKALDIAIRMKRANFPIDQISDFTKLTIPEIEAIQL